MKLRWVFKLVRTHEIFVFFLFSRQITLTTKPKLLHRLRWRVGGGRLGLQLARCFFNEKKRAKLLTFLTYLVFIFDVKQITFSSDTQKLQQLTMERVEGEENTVSAL